MATATKTTPATETKPTNGNVPATTPKAGPPAKVNPVTSLRDLLDKSKGQIALALPKHMTADRMIRIALTAVQRMPKLFECDPLSVVGCVIQASEMGLELTGPLGQAYMIPYFNGTTKRHEAQFQIGYRGLMRLAFNSGLVSTFNAHVVYANDEFSFQYGTRPGINHVPAMKNAGEAIAVYSVLTLKDGTSDFEVMSVEAINKHRDRYARKPKYGEWVWDTAWDEMAKKTVIRRLAKRAPLSAECHLAAAIDEYGEAGVDTLGDISGKTAALTSHRLAMLKERLADNQVPPMPADDVDTYPGDDKVQAQTAPGDEHGDPEPTPEELAALEKSDADETP